MRTICLDMDDFSVLNNKLDLLLKLKEAYPNLKVSMFTIPCDVAYESNFDAKLVRDRALAKVKENLDWIEIIPHGLTHMPREFEKCTYELMKDKVIPAIDEAFKKDGLPYVKGFKAPYWLWNDEVIRALDDAGWWGAIDRKVRNIKKTKRFYVFTHTINELFYNSTCDLLKLHGHITSGMPDNLDLCLTNLFKMPSDAEFKFASELVEEE
jgi:hypothetical protein